MPTNSTMTNAVSVENTDADKKKQAVNPVLSRSCLDKSNKGFLDMGYKSQQL